MGIFVVPAAPYLSALGVKREALRQALGLSFTVSTVALAIGLAPRSNYPPQAALDSLAAVVSALLGMHLGQRLRQALNPETFRI